MIDPRSQQTVHNPLLHLNHGNTHGSSFVAPPRPTKPTRTRAECDAELLDFLVEKTLQSFMPLATPATARQHRRGKKRTGKKHVGEEEQT